MYSAGYGTPDMPPTPTGSWNRAYYTSYEDPTPSGPIIPGTPLGATPSFGASRPHSPSGMHQSDLFSMPLQSPQGGSFLPPNYLSSPSGTLPFGFSPSPVGRRSDAHFPLPPLQGTDDLPPWGGPTPRGRDTPDRGVPPRRR